VIIDTSYIKGFKVFAQLINPMTRYTYFVDDPGAAHLAGRQVLTVQRAWLEYLRSGGIGSTPVRFKDSEDNRIHKLVLATLTLMQLSQACSSHGHTSLTDIHLS
jgi:hypothetical protein